MGGSEHSRYARSNTARDTKQEPLSSLRFRGEIGRNDWAAPEPVTGWNSLLR
jgi:hypothetical protein